MAHGPSINSREAAYDYLDDYASGLKVDMGEEKLGGGLISSYWLEFHSHGESRGFSDLLASEEWELSPIEDGSLYFVREAGRPLGFAEAVTDRHLLIHSTQPTQKADAAVQRRVSASSALDFAWLSGGYLEALWKQMVLNIEPQRTSKLKFDHRSQFVTADDFWPEEDDSDDYLSRPSSVSVIKERSDRLAEILPELQAIHKPFHAISMLSIPSYQARGAYDLWSWGKLTYRSESFRRGRTLLDAFTSFYERLVDIIEHRLWYFTEEASIPDGRSRVRVQGAPLFISFDPMLEDKVFESMVVSTFDRSRGPLRLWGNPIWVGPRRVHVYGIDKHLWQRIYLELTPRGMTVILPRGTCGNTVNRLLANVQRYVAPAASAWIGDVSYDDLVAEVLAGDADTPTAFEA